MNELINRNLDLKNITYNENINIDMYVCKVICPKAGLSLDMHTRVVHISVF